jgi:hypothetical protein
MVHLMISWMELHAHLLSACKVNRVQVSILNEEIQQVLSIFAKFNDDQDTVVLQFPLKIKTSNYTEVTVTNQTVNIMQF